MNINFKKIFPILLLIYSACSFGQANTELDTINTFRLSIPPEAWEYHFNENFYLDNISAGPLNKFMYNDSTSVWLQARMLAGSFNNQNETIDNPASKMMTPMLNIYKDSQKLAALKAILGSVQVGAVAYLAYKHIKKYGFLKK